MSDWCTSLLNFEQENIPLKKLERPHFISKTIFFISKVTQGKSVYLLKDCLVSMESEEELFHPDPMRQIRCVVTCVQLTEISWEKNCFGALNLGALLEYKALTAIRVSNF